MYLFNKFQINKEYTYEYIEDIANNVNISFTEYGNFIVGKNFISLSDTKFTVSFVLTGTRGDDSIWKCIYKN